MPNKDHTDHSGPKAPTKKGKPAPGVKPDRTVPWPSPGNKQTENRTLGVPKVRTSVHEDY